MGNQEGITRLCVGFFFQAEDGIRDYKVTGVQTCALPIYVEHTWALGDLYVHGEEQLYQGAPAQLIDWSQGREQLEQRLIRALTTQSGLGQIGRASCRERV